MGGLGHVCGWWKPNREMNSQVVAWGTRRGGSPPSCTPRWRGRVPPLGLQPGQRIPPNPGGECSVMRLYAGRTAEPKHHATGNNTTQSTTTPHNERQHRATNNHTAQKTATPHNEQQHRTTDDNTAQQTTTDDNTAQQTTTLGQEDRGCPGSHQQGAPQDRSGCKNPGPLLDQEREVPGFDTIHQQRRAAAWTPRWGDPGGAVGRPKRYGP